MFGIKIKGKPQKEEQEMQRAMDSAEKRMRDADMKIDMFKQRLKMELEIIDKQVEAEKLKIQLENPRKAYDDLKKLEIAQVPPIPDIIPNLKDLEPLQEHHPEFINPPDEEEIIGNMKNEMEKMIREIVKDEIDKLINPKKKKNKK